MFGIAVAHYFIDFVRGDCVLHTDGCASYNSYSHWFAWEKKEDVGLFRCPEAALKQAHSINKRISPCFNCLQSYYLES